jgi:small subunit ribosomal protein S1
MTTDSKQPPSDPPPHRRVKIGSQREQYHPVRTEPPAPPPTKPPRNEHEAVPGTEEKPAPTTSLTVATSATSRLVPGTEEKPAPTTSAAAIEAETRAVPPALATPMPPAPAPLAPPPAGGSPDSGERPSRPRRGKGDKGKAKESAPPVETVTPPPLPPRSARNSPELEEEIEAALGGVSLDSLMGQKEAAGEIGVELELDTRIRGTVEKIYRDNVFFSLPRGQQGVASTRQFARPPEPGTPLDVVPVRFHGEEGLYELTVPGGSIDVGDWSDLAEGVVVEARVTGHNKGGLECLVNTIRGFIPASQASLYRAENLAEYVDKKLKCLVTEADRERRNLVLSHRAVLEKEKEEARKSLLEQLEVGQVKEGIVRRIQDFGAFVDIGGIDGLVHVSQLSWDRVSHPSEVLQEGQRIQVRVEKVDRTTGKIGLSYRELQEHPWHTAEEKFPVGSVVKGTVTRLADFGAFVKVGPGIEGLVHISELAHHRVVRVSNVVSDGQEVEVKILSIDREAQRMSLSLKAVQAAPAPAADESAPSEEPEPPRQPAVPRKNAPLKGGVDRPSGGGPFGLTW